MERDRVDDHRLASTIDGDVASERGGAGRRRQRVERRLLASAELYTPVTATITGSHTGAITVGTGQNVLVSPGAVVTGPIKVQAGGSPDIERAKVTGSLTATGAGTIRACGSTLTGPVTITADIGQVTFGDGGSCAGNTITGPIKVTAGTGTGVTF